MSPWRTWTYCATCDGPIRPDAETCPHCGITFGPHLTPPLPDQTQGSNR